MEPAAESFVWGGVVVFLVISSFLNKIKHSAVLRGL